VKQIPLQLQTPKIGSAGTKVQKKRNVHSVPAAAAVFFFDQPDGRVNYILREHSSQEMLTANLLAMDTMIHM
jgi:hypothetical protein